MHQQLTDWNYERVTAQLFYSIKLSEAKVCKTCDTVHVTTPPSAIICQDGFLWFHCECGSTLTVGTSNV
jgi:hypothetical protein